MLNPNRFRAPEDWPYERILTRDEFIEEFYFITGNGIIHDGRNYSVTDFFDAHNGLAFGPWDFREGQLPNGTVWSSVRMSLMRGFVSLPRLVTGPVAPEPSPEPSPVPGGSQEPGSALTLPVPAMPEWLLRVIATPMRGSALGIADRFVIPAGVEGPIPVLFDNGPVILTSEELSALAALAPHQQDTRSAIPHPGRRFTQAELVEWIHEYRKLGGFNAFELEVVRLINEYRAQYGLHPLAICMQLSMAARFHSYEMLALFYLAHQSPYHGAPWERASMFGRIGVASETAGAGSGSPQGQVNGWINSPPHRAILLTETRHFIGVGRVGGFTTAKYGI